MQDDADLLRGHFVAGLQVARRRRRHSDDAPGHAGAVDGGPVQIPAREARVRLRIVQVAQVVDRHHRAPGMDERDHVGRDEQDARRAAGHLRAQSQVRPEPGKRDRAQPEVGRQGKAEQRLRVLLR